MSSGQLKCKNCNTSDVEIDNARGDAVCIHCGTVLEDNIIVSEVQFEEGSHGKATAVGQFVAADSKGAATGYGKFHVGMGVESREVTLRKARQGITHLSNQLHLNQHCIDTACNFFKMALMRHLTRGRKNSHIYAACVYITCRTEGTSHLMIDISDILQICCYELGRTYLKLSQALCINIPTIDPCIYIMRFAAKLQFGDKTNDVSNTAQRLIKRMKKDFIHLGRRPSGCCGAALLIAARMHDFNRTPMDIVRIVKIHESTLRKRLMEFGDTPSSELLLDKFMEVDLEAEQDPPSFKAARKKDKERLQKISENDKEFTTLQKEIEACLDKDMSQKQKRLLSEIDDTVVNETEETDVFIRESTVDVIQNCLSNNNISKTDDINGGNNENINQSTITTTMSSSTVTPYAIKNEPQKIDGLRPDIISMCLQSSQNNSNKFGGQSVAKGQDNKFNEEDTELDINGLDDDEINGYIMSESEAQYKDVMWRRLNAEYLNEVRIREERLAKEREEGKPEKKRRRTIKKRNFGPSNSANEAIEKMLQEKKMSKKINYDVLRRLGEPKPNDCDEAIDAAGSNSNADLAFDGDIDRQDKEKLSDIVEILNESTSSISTSRKPYFTVQSTKGKRASLAGLPVVETNEITPELNEETINEDDIDDYEDDPEPEAQPEHTFLENVDEEEFSGYEEDY